jgi:hypothetical protein
MAATPLSETLPVPEQLPGEPHHPGLSALQEQAWFSRNDGPRRCVLRFSEYVRDLEGTMRKVYRECLDTEELPPHVPRQHPPRKRTQYLLDRSLAQVGVNEAELDARLAPYIAWCRQSSSQPGQLART